MNKDVIWGSPRDIIVGDIIFEGEMRDFDGI